MIYISARRGNFIQFLKTQTAPTMDAAETATDDVLFCVSEHQWLDLDELKHRGVFSSDLTHLSLCDSPALLWNLAAGGTQVDDSFQIPGSPLSAPFCATWRVSHISSICDIHPLFLPPPLHFPPL